MLEETIEARAVALLKKKGYKIACAESCTGGLLTGRLVDVPDASRVLDMSFVTYANEAKIRLLGVDAALIEQFGVVSEPVAAAMAAGVAQVAQAAVGIGVSGIAGPSGGSAEKPVGTVCFGFYLNGRITTEKRLFADCPRNEVRRKSVELALNRLVELLSE